MSQSQGDFVTVVDIPEVLFVVVYNFAQYSTHACVSVFSVSLIASFIFVFYAQGVHKFKFVVDGVETVDRNAPLDETKGHNVMNVKKSDFEVFEALAMDLASNNTNTGNNNNTANTQPPLSGSPPGSYTQEIPSADGSGNVPSTGPPFLPPHLLQVILNNPSTNFGEPTLLPQPNHVMLNHLYALSIKVGHAHTCG